VLCGLYRASICGRRNGSNAAYNLILASPKPEILAKIR
jgi:hypothetical protein